MKGYALALDKGAWRGFLNIPNGDCQRVPVQGLDLVGKAYFAAAAQFFQFPENLKSVDIGQHRGPVFLYLYRIKKIVLMNKQINFMFFFIPEKVQLRMRVTVLP
jgi:hypothetical protein